MIRVLLVDDHALVRTGIRRVLEEDAEIVVVGEASTGEMALALLTEACPQVVVLDVSMPGMGGLEATHRLLRRDPGLRIVVVTVHGAGPFPRRFLEAGALGYLHKGCNAEECRRAVHLAARGQVYISQEVAQHLAFARGGPGDAFADLSEQEFEVMLRAARGYSTEETAEALFLSPKTVATYRSRIFRKLGVRGVVDLAHLAVSHAMIEPALARSALEVRGGRPARAPRRGAARRPAG
jgi:two-component system invasion response regulator UvrY